MFRIFDGAKTRPKILKAIDEAIYNGAKPPIEILIYKYRKLFNLSHKDMMHEPVDEFYTNLYIYAGIKEKSRLEAKHGNG